MPIIQNGNLPTQNEIRSVLARLEQLGADPSEARSCLPSAGMRGKQDNVKGCNCYDRCPFGSRKFGGFKGQGPKRIKVYLNPNDKTNHQQELAFTCFDYVRLMLERAKSGARDREEGHAGEIVAIVGGEPGVVIPGIDPARQHVCRTLVMVKEQPDSPVSKFKNVVQEVPIAPFEYSEAERGTEFSEMLENQYMTMIRHDADYGGPAPTAPEFEGVGDTIADADLDLDAVATPVAEPANKGRK